MPVLRFMERRAEQQPEAAALPKQTNGNVSDYSAGQY